MNDNINPDIEKEKLRRRSTRNWAVFLFLLVFVVLIYGVTIVRMKQGMLP